MRFDPSKFGIRHQLWGLFGLFLLTGMLVLVLDEVGQYYTQRSMLAMKDDVLAGMRRIRRLSDAYSQDVVNTTFRTRNYLVDWDDALATVDRARATIDSEWRALQASDFSGDDRALLVQALSARPRADAAVERLRAALVAKDIRALGRFADGAPAQQVHEAVRDIEARADELVYEIEEQLARVFVTPIDREDIQLLAASIDDIVDIINLTARTFVLFGVPQPTPPMVELMGILVKMAEHLKAELPALRKHDYPRLIAAGRVIRDHEKVADRVFRNAVGELFHDPSIDAKVLLRDKEVLEDLEGAIDKCETVAERLKNLAVKHG